MDKDTKDLMNALGINPPTKELLEAEDELGKLCWEITELYDFYPDKIEFCESTATGYYDISFNSNAKATCLPRNTNSIWFFNPVITLSNKYSTPESIYQLIEETRIKLSKYMM